MKPKVIVVFDRRVDRMHTYGPYVDVKMFNRVVRKIKKNPELSVFTRTLEMIDT